MIDFDGVIRHWPNVLIAKCETDNKLKLGSLFSIAFSPTLLNRAITGMWTHEEWVEHVQQALREIYGLSIADQLVASWCSTEATIDYDFLNNIKVAAPNSNLVLVTNATSQLSSDLDKYTLQKSFDIVINSSEIKVAKPDHRFFEETLNILKVIPNDCIFIDDSIKNVIASKSLGIHSLHHKSASKTLQFIKKNCA
jgi:putative hydrolase of the HAD superfamily